MEYLEFLESKRLRVIPSGFDISVEDINPLLFDFQKDIVRWSLGKGKTAVFAGTGLGKTLMQLEWACHVYKHTNRNVLILAPLAVASQTAKEAEKLGIKCNVCRDQKDIRSGINITNYEMVDHFDESTFSGIVLDESSILKHFEGSTRTKLIEKFRDTPYKLACTATPAPNDYIELGNHSEFLGVLNRTEMLAEFFIHDGGDTAKWRLKGHAVKAFWEWVASWAVMMIGPGDLGYTESGEKFKLPKLEVHEVVVDKSGYYVREAKTLQDRRRARSETITDRVSCAVEVVKKYPSEPILIWCNLNAESDALAKAISDSIEVRGSQNNDFKADAMLGFSSGKNRILVSKPSICGFGMNWQHCTKMVFVGLSDSFEQYYQAVRRCWRFGQDKPVDVYIITSEREGAVVANIKRKERDFELMLKGMISATQEITSTNIRKTRRTDEEYITTVEMKKPSWLNTEILK